MKITIPKGVQILAYLQNHNINISAPCNGIGKCGKCKIKVISPYISTTMEEKNLLTKTEIAENIRLACMHTTRYETIIDIIVPASTMDILDTFESANIQSIYHIKNNQIYQHHHMILDDIEALGVAVDIGTTTCVMMLVDIVTGHVLGSTSFINPQTRYGHDVISRLTYAMSLDGLKKLNQVIIERLNTGLNQLLNESKKRIDSILNITIAGNTTMNHLLLGKDPSSMAKIPFKATLLDEINVQAKTYFPILSKQTILRVLPSLDAFVGADIISGVYATGMHLSNKNHLLIDLGTNGEMIVGNQNHYIAASTAAGPAFEGINITCGLGAIGGALSSFEINSDKQMKFDTLEHLPVKGICGSGLIDLVSTLLSQGIISQSGYMKSAFYITNDIYLTPKDVRQVQLAKSAIRAGIEVLLERSKISPEAIGKVYIAGGFGKHIQIKHLFNLGILPKEFIGKVEVVGNSALSGAYQILLSDATNDLKTIISKSKCISLSEDKDFQDKFITYLSF